MAAGHAPQEFWRQTFRSYDRLMRAARTREVDRMVMTASAVWHGVHSDHAQLLDWMRAVRGEDVLPEEVLGAVLRMRGMACRRSQWNRR